ncbi:MAG: lipid A biosynthesis acyltransferase [Candidatus Thiodiazotropha sp.]|jgi:predicted LPLAT superfamily acyltransferase
MSKWVAKKERGSLWSMRLILFLCRHTSHGVIRPLLYPISAYFFFTSADTRTASLKFYKKVKGKSSWLDYFRQLLCFAETLLDRIYILSGNSDRYQVNATGRDMLIEEHKRGRGIILLGSHLGSFEAIKVLVREKVGLDVYMVAYFAGSQKIRTILDELNPELSTRIIDPTSPDAIFHMREVVEAGGVLAILTDRVGIGEKRATARFFGEETEFPAGPFLIAHILGCPVYSFFGLLSGHCQYDSYLERVAERIELPRNNRQQALNRYVQRYAERLEHFCRRYPYNWFNFYDYWKRES